MSKILIKNGRILDPETGSDMQGDVLIEDGKITRVEKSIDAAGDASVETVIDASSCYVMPGLIDLHVHLRDPGQTDKEDIQTGSRAAARGGVTTMVAMPNTTPPIDTADKVSYVHNKAEAVSKVTVLQTGTVTNGMKGEALSDIEGMARVGIPGITEDGKSVMNAEIYREAMIRAKENNLVVFAHCEDINLVNKGCVNADENARRMNLPGITNSVEDVITARDILLAGETGVRLHLCHCSTKLSYYMLKEAKANGVDVTGEVCPHHFTLTSDDIIEGDTNFKMNPPLRSKEDLDYLRRGLKENVFDVISTDHAPHTLADKNKPMESAAFGIVGLETSVPLTITELVHTGVLTPLQMAEKMSYQPAKILGLSNKGGLMPGKDGDVTIINPDISYRINPESFASKSKNTPFGGREVYGKVMYTIAGGEIIYREGMENK